MVADNLLIWDKIELSCILANKYSDEEDLLEAFPLLGDANNFEYNLFKGFVEENWWMILDYLQYLDPTGIYWWLINKQISDDYEYWRTEIIIQNEEYFEEMEIQGYRDFVELMESFRDMDFAEMRGYPSKYKRTS